MSAVSKTYVPPATEKMARQQNDTVALRLLLAQRKYYNRAKVWAHLRYSGLAFVGVAAPVIAFSSPVFSVAIGAGSGLWIFIARLVFARIERMYAGRGATVQEAFDHYVFSMPSPPPRVPAVSPEEVSKILGDQRAIVGAIEKQKLRDWYTFDTRLPGATSVAIAQRANAIYSEGLLRVNAWAWLALTASWVLVAAFIGLGLGLNLEQFLLGVFLPLLPAILDVYEQWEVTCRASAERRALADSVESALRESDIDPAALVAWQTTLYQLRKESPQVPNVVYWAIRKRNERAMADGAAEMSRIARERAFGSLKEE